MRRHAVQSRGALRGKSQRKTGDVWSDGKQAIAYAVVRYSGCVKVPNRSISLKLSNPDKRHFVLEGTPVGKGKPGVQRLRDDEEDEYQQKCRRREDQPANFPIERNRDHFSVIDRVERRHGTGHPSSWSGPPIVSQHQEDHRVCWKPPGVQSGIQRTRCRGLSARCYGAGHSGKPAAFAPISASTWVCAAASSGDFSFARIAAVAARISTPEDRDSRRCRYCHTPRTDRTLP